MKKDLNNLYNDEVDKLLFDYLEGDLSPQAAMALEEKLNYDANLKEELKHWSDAYIEQDFYPTDSLEEKINQNTFKNRKVSTESYILIVALFTSFLSFMPFTLEKEHQPIFPKIQPEQSIKIEEEKAPLSDQSVNEIFTPNPVVEKLVLVDGLTKEEVSNKVEEKVISNSNIDPLPLSDFNLDGIVITEDIKEYPVNIQKPEKVKKAKSFKISKKEQRAIERAKEKALQKRVEEKYVRGRKPYVVPLSPNF